MVIIRIAEIFIDPLLGNLIDNTNTKWGRFRPWQFFGGLISAVLLAVIFSGMFGLVNVNTTLFIVLFVITFVVLDVFYSLRDISYWGMIPALSSDSHERSTYTALGSFGGSIGYNGITVIVITHQMSVVEQICTRVAILDGGEVAEEGKVSEVFAAPQSQAAKRLVYPEGYEQPVVKFDEGRMLRVVFNGAKATKTPLIAQMALDCGITASILGASTKGIGEKAYGNMLLGIPGGDADGVMAGIDFMRQVNLHEKKTLSGKVVLIGGGNIGADVARTAVRCGAESVDL